MALVNKSLGYLYRAVSGSARTSQAVSISGLAGGGSNISFSSFAFDSVTATLPFTYIVENTTENLVFSFTGAGARFDSKVKDVSNNYNFTVSPNDGGLTFGTNAGGNDGVKAATTKIAVTNISNGVYAGNAQYSLSAAYNDGGWSENQTGFNQTFGKTIYTVDSYNSTNSDVLCVDINTLILLSNGTEVKAEDLYVGDVIKTYVPTDMPEWLPESDVENWYWWYQTGSSGEIVNATVSNIYYSFVDSYVSINDGLLKCTNSHPLFIFDDETSTYQFVRAEDIEFGDKLIKYNNITSQLEEIDVIDVEIKNETLEIATITVDTAHTYLSNGFVSHNKGSNTAAPIPSSDLVMYLDPERTASYSASGQQVWYDLTGRNTGLDVKAVSGTAPTFNNTSPKSISFASGQGGKKDSAVASGQGISNFELTTAGATLVWWQKGNAGNATTVLQVQGATSNFSFGIYGNAATSLMGFTVSYPNSGGLIFVSDFATDMTAGSWHMFVIRIAADGRWIYQNNNLIRNLATQEGAGVPTSGTGTVSTVLMQGAAAGIELGPVLFYKRGLTTQEQTDIWNNLRGRFGR